MKKAYFFKIRGMPEISSLLSMYFSEIQTIGLLASFYVGPPKRDELLKRIPDRLGPLITLFTIAEKYFEGKLIFHSTPILYNSKNWISAKILGGYIDPNLDIKASELVSSYVACWNFVGSYTRLVKAALWYVKSRGNFMDGFDYLADLFETGYVINPEELFAAGLILLELYGKVSEPFKIFDRLSLDIDPASTDPMLKTLKKATTGRNVNEQRIREVYSRILKRVLDEVTEARGSHSIGDFLLSAAKISGLYRLLLIIINEYKSDLKLSVSDQAVLSQIEEINADFVAAKLMLLTAPRHLPLVQDPFGHKLSGQTLLAILVGMDYSQKYGGEAAEKLFEDRLLVPYHLKGTFKQIFGKEKPNDKSEGFKIPNEWNYFPLTFSFILGVIKDIEPSLMRSELFAKNLILTEIQNLFDKYEFSNSQIENIIDGQYSYVDTNPLVKDGTEKRSLAKNRVMTKRSAKQYIIGHFYDIYHDLCLKEQEERFLPLILDSDKFTESKQFLHRRSQLAQLSKLYPWQASIHHEMSIDSDKLADEKEARKNISAALLLDPNRELFWKSMEVICSRYGTKKDARFAGLIGYILRSRDSKQNVDGAEVSSIKGTQ